ncbi:pullulanase-type alpha-1,6-glucosidase [Enterovibrio coralii]|uniref:Type II secretion protein n=1 Tax=Enterovibrio coralii TaxID=294935 RepID=A0A135I7U2_9GAMM|nr:pullulanase-type alpha-1,6-glucosidase [Enterovibrio coralii]KXF81525.1 hypothetical protein ATN88_02140 [Enterovibrio coralii]
MTLHVWNTDKCSAYKGADTDWNRGLQFDGVDDAYGAYWDLPIHDSAQGCINFIPHRGDEKPLPQDAKAYIEEAAKTGFRVFTFKGDGNVYYEPLELPPLNLAGATAHWVDVQTLLTPADVTHVELYQSFTGKVNISGDEISGFDKKLDATANAESRWQSRFPHLGGMASWHLPLTNDDAKSLLKGQLVAVAKNAEGRIVSATQVQFAGVLDTLYVENGTANDDSLMYGATVTTGKTAFRLWAPTAQSVSLVRYNNHKTKTDTIPMQFDAQSGSWFVETDKLGHGDFYRYNMTAYHPAVNEVRNYEVTDPYSLSLSTNSTFSQVVDLNHPDLKPTGWDALQSPHSQQNPAKMVIYESHIRDLSALDASVSDAHRGKFKALTETASTPVKHLTSLAQSGVTHLHLLPVFDIVSVNEDPAKVIDIHQPFCRLCDINPTVKNSEFASYCNSGKTVAEVFEILKVGDGPDSPLVQKLNRLVAGHDSFNWGYDPYHYTAPEGSYSTQPDGMTRIREFREMVMSIKQNIGMNVIMDVVYNHTNAVGPDAEHSVLDKVVPWYYQRLNTESGAVETSTCCSNTAPENAMMGRLIRDSLVVWSKDYRVDAFRFDLMGHHPKAQILEAREAVRQVNPDTYFYGEGWNFGEVANNTRFEQAIQGNMAGTGVGTFSDRLRDAVRGGGPFDGGDALRANQGFGNGAFVMPNEMNGVSRETALHSTDLVRLGMAGNLKSYELTTHTGERKRGEQIDYNGQPAGYAEQPTEVQNYVSKHDNQTLWDNNQYKIPYDAPLDIRVRMQTVSLATAMLGQGVPFTHQGVELLRSKSMQRDSYDSGDWYNLVDYSLQDNNWNKGLPREDKDGPNYGMINTVIEGHGDNAKPGHTEMQTMVSYYKELASLRAHYPLITLGSADDVLRRVGFLNTGPSQTAGLVVMTIDNGINAGDDLDSNVDGLVVVINASPEHHRMEIGQSGLTLSAKHTSDLKGDARVDGTAIVVPAWTPAVFELTRNGSRGAGIPPVAN